MEWASNPDLDQLIDLEQCSKLVQVGGRSLTIRQSQVNPKNGITAAAIKG